MVLTFAIFCNCFLGVWGGVKCNESNSKNFVDILVEISSVKPCLKVEIILQVLAWPKGDPEVNGGHSPKPQRRVGNPNETAVK